MVGEGDQPVQRGRRVLRGGGKGKRGYRGTSQASPKQTVSDCFPALACTHSWICQSSRHERISLQQQKADWNMIKKHIPQAVDEVMDNEPEMMTLFLKFVSCVSSHR